MRGGRLTVVGTGIMPVAHLTLEAIGYIKNADIVFYHATSGVMASHILELNSNVIDLYQYYDEGKIRNVTYVQMSELILREVRRGLSVVGLFYGHPGFFVKPARRALAIARMEGFETRMLPGISTVDCLFADLGVDPGMTGLQILQASQIFRASPPFLKENHLVLIQIGCVGDRTFSFSGCKNAKIPELFEKLISIYGEDQDSVYYVASIFPGLDPTINVRQLGEYREAKAQRRIGPGTLYIPPAGVSYESLAHRQAFNKIPYGQFELDSIASLEGHQEPATFKKRRASKAFLETMVEVATVPRAKDSYRASPKKFLAQYPELTAEELSALLSHKEAKLRSVTTVRRKHGEGN